MAYTTQQLQQMGATPGPIGGKKGESDTSEIAALYSEERGQRILEAAKELEEDAKKHPEIFGRTAALPLPLSMRSDAFRDFRAKLIPLKSSVFGVELTAMREASKTGGAVGQVSDAEGARFEQALGALDMTQSPKAFVRELQKIQEISKRWRQKVAQLGGVQTLLQTPAEAGAPVLPETTPGMSGEVKIRDTQTGEVRRFPAGTVPPPSGRYQIVK